MRDLTRPSVALMLVRGAFRRCPLCGGGKLFRRWFQMTDHCPRCGMKFEREEGSFVGGMFINIAVTEAVLCAFIISALALTLPDPPVPLLLVGAVLISVVLPVLGYPFSKTIWTAVHLAMQPLEAHEEAEAAATRFELEWDRTHQV